MNGLGRGRLPFQGDLVLLHGFEQGGLGFGRRPVNLVRQQDIGKKRPLAQLKLVFIAVEYIAAGDVSGQQIGRELDAVEPQPQGGGKAVSHQGFGEARVILQQDVAAGREKCRHHPGDHIVLPDDRLLDLPDDPRREIGHLFNAKGCRRVCCHVFSPSRIPYG